MNPWLTDPSSTPNNHVGFGGPMDAGMSFLQPPQTINPAQFQNPAFLNGGARTASPGFHNPAYQTNSVIPSKRARDDSLGASPRQMPGGLPGSRSQTPGQGLYPGFNPQANGVPAMPTGPTPFPHLQQPSSNATPSPTTQQISQFNHPGGNQRVATASPSPFSPQQHGGPQASPAPSDHASRVGTPHDNPHNFMPNGGFPPGFNQPQYGQNMSNGVPPQMGMNPQGTMALQHPGMSAAQRNYQMQFQAQARQMQAQTMAGMNGMPNNPGQPRPNSQMSQGPPGAFAPPKPSNPEEFIRGLQTFMAARGRSVDLNPVICGRPLQLLRLYAAVVKNGGSQRISKLNQWAAIAQQFGFPPQQHMQAAQELQAYWMHNLAPYEAAWQMSQQKQRMAAQAAAQNQAQHQMSPSREVQQQHQPVHQRAPSVNGQAVNQVPQPNTNGFVPPHAQAQPEMPTATQTRPDTARQFDPQHVEGVQAPIQTPQKRPRTAPKSAEPEPDVNKPLSRPLKDPFKPEVLPPSRFHGPINVDELFVIGQHIVESKPVVPTIREMGIIDIHALTMSIKSGLHAETRVALDTLVTLSTEPALQLSLVDCDDLMDALLECALDQVNFLSEHATEVSDDMFLPSYEDLVRSCRLENESLQNNTEFGTVAYDLERAADRLICITTLIRNFSFYEANFGVLGQSEVIKLLSTVIRYLATTELFLRTSRNTLDFMKDVVVFLSNLSTSLQLPGKEESLCILHFLLAFAPTPPPITGSSSKVAFTMYTPTLHKYLPSAVDSLAKLLARDEPNRTYFRAIFAADAHSTPPYELLTRSFGLAISPIPAISSHTRTIIETRKPFLLQGMLAAEILAGLAPGSDYSLARSWLESEDGFACNLLRLVGILSADRSTQTAPKHPQPNNRNNPEPDANGYGAIANRALAVLKTLVQKARTVDEDGTTVVPTGVMPRKESLLGAMIQRDIDPGILRQLCLFAALEE
ncbi:SWI/SNF chromatin-remodeling complex subunit sol1 [Exophiala dermatitidis]